ncbi:hypothetical protein F5B17DRAFT_189842 [Nemania serpens]|nr:hypothetical protein F5B17DRAFT_189842 [Nemania serpens]
MLKNLPSTVFQSRKLVSTIARTHPVDAAATVAVSISSSRPHTMSEDQQPSTSTATPKPALPQPPSRQRGMAFFPLGYKEAVQQWVRRPSHSPPPFHSLLVLTVMT